MKKYILFAALLLSGITTASATDYYWNTYNDNVTKWPSAVTACQVPHAYYQYDHVVITPAGTTALCWGRATDWQGNVTSQTITSYDTVYRYGNGCTAPNVLNPDTGSCDAPACPSSGTSAGTSWITTGWSTGSSVTSPLAKKVIADGSWSGSLFTDGKCEIKVTGNPITCTQGTTPNAGGYYAVSCQGTMQYTGGLATDGEVSPANPTSAPTVPSPGKDKCPAGTVSGGIDNTGTPICIGNGTAPSTQDKTTTPTATVTNPDGSTTATKTETRTNADGSNTTTTTTTTTKSDGSISTSTSSGTSATPSGVAGKDDGDNKSFCQQNPNLTICKNSLVSGECEQTACDGDAIQCAILRQQRKEYCDSLKPDSLSELGNAVLNGADPLQGSLPSPANAQVIDVGTSLDASGWLGGGQCFQDKQISVQGHTVKLEFSKACDYLVALRYVIMVIGSLISFRMLSGVFTRE